MTPRILWVMLLCGCVSGVNQVAGVGATYTTRCSAKMNVEQDVYKAMCTPPSCAKDFREVAVNHVVVALDPGEKLVGYQERVCIQDLSNATKQFAAALPDEENPESSKTPAAEPSP